MRYIDSVCASRQHKGETIVRSASIVKGAEMTGIIAGTAAAVSGLFIVSNEDLFVTNHYFRVGTRSVE